MIINKITHGFVIQSWDTEKKQFVSQEFVGRNDESEWEYADMNQPDVDETQDPQDVAFGSNNSEEPYLATEMIQPPEYPSTEDCSVCGETTNVRLTEDGWLCPNCYEQ